MYEFKTEENRYIMRYLNPKADLTFKRVFGEHPDLVKSFLNALLPLHREEYITDIEYLPSEMVSGQSPAQEQYCRCPLQGQ